jgi:hypothetical protein
MYVLVRITNEQMSAIKTPCHHHSFNLLDSSDLFSFPFADKSLRFAKVVVCLYRTKSKKKRKETHTLRRLKSFNNKYILKKPVKLIRNNNRPPVFCRKERPTITANASARLLDMRYENERAEMMI